MIDYFLSQMRQQPALEAFVSDNQSATYGQLIDLIEQYQILLEQWRITPGEVVSFDGDYSPSAIAMFMALAANKNIIVPLSKDSAHSFELFRDISQTQYIIELNDDAPKLHRTGVISDHPLYESLKKNHQPGLVLFSSGSTGKHKAIVQNLDKLLAKFTQSRKPLRMLIFLQLDHIGGVNSLLYTLSNLGTLITAQARTPEDVLASIEKHKAQLLPTSPTFLNLISLSKAYERFDLSSLELITYGTEPMQSSTLSRLTQYLPNTRFQQTYGLSEVGILRSKSKSSDSLWMKVGGESFETKIQNGTLWIKADSAMLGYLNAPSPFDESGFLDTGDLVEQDGPWIRILGRASEVINVGGYKVYPAEIESVLLELDNVQDVVVYGQEHPITGKIVCAKFQLIEPEQLSNLKSRMRTFCKNKLEAFKIPSKILISEESVHSERFKRMRR